MKYKEILEKQWLKDVKPKYHPPEGTFTKKAAAIAAQLLKDSSSPAQAMQRLNFYINRAGKDLTNKAELEKAKDIISKKIES